MITKQDLINLYANCIGRISPQVEDSEGAYNEELNDYFINNKGVTSALEELTQEQWCKLIKVCSVISLAPDLFNMHEFHDRKDCGTSHCIAGWAVAIELNQPEMSFLGANVEDLKKTFGLENISWIGTGDIAGAILSPLVYPFFYLTTNVVEDANTVVLEEFIYPILDKARKEDPVSYDEAYLSSLELLCPLVK